jgi:hypothetical protein
MRLSQSARSSAAPVAAAALDSRSRRTRIADGFAVIFSRKLAVERLAAVDFEVTVQRQPELIAAPEEVVERARQRTKEVVKYRVDRLRQVHPSALGLILSAAMTAFFLNRFIPVVPPQGRQFSALASVGVFAWATLARLGWLGQSIKGDTAIERIDETWFWVLYWFATVLGAASVV